MGEIKPNIWAMLCHLAGLTAYVTGGIGAIVAPLVLWLVMKDTVPAVAHHGKEALNFNITVVAGEALLLLFGIIAMPGFAEAQLVMLGFVGLLVFHIAFVIRAAICAYRGTSYRYPWTLRFVR